MTCLLRLQTWTSSRNPHTSPPSRHRFVTLPPVSRQPLRPLSLPNAVVSHNRPHTPPVGLAPPPPVTKTPLAKRKGKKELLRLHPHHHLIQSGPPPQLTRISRDTTCRLPPPHYMATLRRSPRNTPTPGKRRNSPKGTTPRHRLDPRSSGPDWRPPTTMTSKATPTYAQAATPPAKGKKGRQAKGPVSASSVAVA